jgi:hemerythrin-like metal-binding protein
MDMNAKEGFLLEWSDAMSVGNYSIDHQHQKLLLICRRCEKLQDTLSSDDVELFHEQLHELQQYAQVHFAAEEGLLVRIGYPNLEVQHQEHLQYQDELAELLYRAVVGTLPVPNVLQFLSAWWANHILISDMEYAPYLNSSKNIVPRDFHRSDSVENEFCRRLIA